MHFDKYKYLTPHKNNEDDGYPRSPRKNNFQNRPQSPKYKDPPRSPKRDPYQPKRDPYSPKQYKESGYSPRQLPSKTSENRSTEPKLDGLIMQALSSADKMAQELLSYGQTESDYVCSTYFLSRQKLYSYLSSHKPRILEQQFSKNSKKSSWKKDLAQESGSSEGTQEVPIDHLERLERIIYNQVIPIMQTELNYQRKKVEKSRRPRQWAFGDIKQGLILLQRLQQKKMKTDLDDYAQVLEKFIRRVMDKEEALMNKLSRLQQKLETEIQKTDHLSRQNRRREAEPQKNQLMSLEKDNKDQQLYRSFVKDIKALIKESSKDSSPRSLKSELSQLLSQIRQSIGHDSKGCPHKQQKHQKQLNTQLKQELSRSQDKIKQLRVVVENYDKQFKGLEEQCQKLEKKLLETIQKLAKVESNLSKLGLQNEDLYAKIQRLTGEDHYKNKVIGDYINALNNMDENLRSKDEKYARLQQEYEKCQENLAKKEEDFQRMLRHVEEIEDRNKELEELEDQAHRDLEELIQKNYVREFQVAHITNTFERNFRELEDLRQAVREKDQIIALLDVNKEYILDKLETESKRDIRHSLQHRSFESQNEADIPPYQEGMNLFDQLSQRHQLNGSFNPHFLHQQVAHSISQSFAGHNPHHIYHQAQGANAGAHHMYNHFHLQPNPLNSNPGVHLQLPQIMNQLGSNASSGQTNNTLLDNTVVTPQFNDNVDQGEAHQVQQHHELKKYLAHKFSDYFRRLSLGSNVGNETQIAAAENRQGKPEVQTDELTLQKSIELLQNGAKLAQQQIERLKRQNQLLKVHNQMLFQKAYGPSMRQQDRNHLQGMPIHGFMTQGEFNNVQRHIRPDFIPGHINKQIIQEVIKDLDQQKKSVDQRSHNLEEEINLLKRESDMLSEHDPDNSNTQLQGKHRREDWVPGRRYQEEDHQAEQQQKKRRDDWDPGHRFMDEENEAQPQEKKRREDWDPGHRYKEEVEGEPQEGTDNQPVQYTITVDPEKIGNSSEDSGGIEMKEDGQDNQKRQIISQSESPGYVPNIVEEFISEKEPTVDELLKEEKSESDKKKSDMIPIQSDKDSHSGHRQLIKIEERQTQARNPNEEFVDDEIAQGNPEEKEELRRQQTIPLGGEMDEADKIKQLLQATQHIKEEMRKTLQNKDGGIDYQSQIRSFFKSIQALENMLVACKKATTKKFNTLRKIQLMKHEAEEEIRSLKKKLQTANQLFSNITSNQECYDLSFSEQLQEILKRSPKLADENFEGRTKSVNEVAVQTDRSCGVLQSSVRRYLPADFKRFMSSESLVNSLLNKSFIEELESLNIQKLPNEEKMKKIESGLLETEMLEFKEERGSSEQHQSNSPTEDLKRSRIRLESEVKEIGNMIAYHRDQILYLHNLLTKTTTASMPALRESNSSFETPRKAPLVESLRLTEEINRAPQKHDAIAMWRFVNELSEEDIRHRKEVEEVIKNRQSEFEQLLNEKEEEINRLKAIVKKLTEISGAQDHRSPSQSRSRERQTDYHELEALKAKLVDLQVAFEKQKTENEKLRLEIKQQQVQQELLKIKFRETYELQINSFREISHHEHELSKNKQESNKENGSGKILDEVSEDKKLSKKGSDEKPERANIQAIDSKAAQQAKHEAELVEQPESRKAEEQKQKQLSPKEESGKRFTRKSERISRQKQSFPGAAQSEVKIKQQLKDLLPQFFGGDHKK